MSGTADALNRIADALFQVAKEHRAQNSLAKRSLEMQEALLEMQRTNLAVSKHLEAELIMRQSGARRAD
jgi:hypothetical protein